MGKSENIPTPAVRRLSLYLRQLETFHGGGRQTVSSKQLGAALSISDAQVRKDLAYFGQFGHSGIGYRVPELVLRIRVILGTDKDWNVLLVGVGNLGRALLSFRGFVTRGFRIVAAFDNDPSLIGRKVGDGRRITIEPLSKVEAVARSHSIRIGIVSVPAASAQFVAEQLVSAGIRGILNFAPVRLQLDGQVAVSSVDLAVHLEQLSFQLNGAPA